MDRLSAMSTFARVVETGSFSATARHLRVGQPAVSKAVAQLEERLGVQLLVRSTRGLSVTDAGQRFYERAKRAIDEADEAEIAARGAAATLTGRLRVSTSVAMARMHIIPHLGDFLAAHPKLDLDFAMDDRQIDLVEEGMDVAIRLGALTDSTLTARPIAQCRRLVLATPAYFARNGEPRTPRDLLAHQAVGGMEPSFANAWTFARNDEEIAVTTSGRLRVNAAEGVRAAVLAGLGLAVASEWLFAPELADGTVSPTLTDWTLPPVQLWAIFPGGRRASARARAFVAFLQSLFAGVA